jgi:acetylornithine deacetylase/succinyl-diaminopimelate desuccinylase-like protein
MPALKEPLLNKLKSYLANKEHDIIREFNEFLSIPNVSSDRANINRNAEFIKVMMEKRGLQASIIQTYGNPVVYGEWNAPNATQTLAFYAHYDGQPVEPSYWIGHQPFQPVLRPGKLEANSDLPKPIQFPPPARRLNEGWRIYARSSSDDKASIMALLAAIDFIQESGWTLKNNLKFIFEGEEEAGSTNLRPFLEKNKNLLKSDILFLCDGPAYYDGTPILFFGVRGILSLEITVFGAAVNLHSGHYGNWAPNPATKLIHLLASMKDDQGKITIDGFYDTAVPLTDSEKQALRNIPVFDEMLKEVFAINGLERKGLTLKEAIQLPSFNVNGLSCGWIGDQARTVIPSSATASIDIRLVKGNDPDYFVKKVKEHIQNQGFHVTEEDPGFDLRMRYPQIVKLTRKDKGYRAQRTPMDHPLCRHVIQNLAEFPEINPLIFPSLGGSLPIYVFSDALAIPNRCFFCQL